MAKENNNSSHGIGFFGLLQVALIVLKLCGVLTCSWVAVFIPTFIWIGIIILVIGIGLLFGWIGSKL